MASLASFLVMFPEFSHVNAARVQAHLDAALLEIDPIVWQGKSDQGQMYLAAHRLSLSPAGNNAELKGATGMTTYGTHYESLVRQVSSGYRVA